MAGAVNAPQTYSIKPQSAAAEMYGGALNLFAPTVEADIDKKGGSADDDKSSSSSDTSSGGSSGSVKVVKL